MARHWLQVPAGGFFCAQRGLAAFASQRAAELLQGWDVRPAWIARLRRWSETAGLTARSQRV